MKTIFHYEILEQEFPTEKISNKAVNFTEKIKDLNDVKKFKKDLTALANEIKLNNAVDAFGKRVHDLLGRSVTAKQNVLLQIYGKAKWETINDKRVSIDGIRGDQTRFIEKKLNELHGFSPSPLKGPASKKTGNTNVPVNTNTPQLIPGLGGWNAVLGNKFGEFLKEVWANSSKFSPKVPNQWEGPLTTVINNIVKNSDKPRFR